MAPNTAFGLQEISPPRNTPRFSQVSQVVEKPEQIKHFALRQNRTAHPELTELPVHLWSMIPDNRSQFQRAAEKPHLAEIWSSRSAEASYRMAFDTLLFLKDDPPP
jgi:hypothetical protein